MPHYYRQSDGSYSYEGLGSGSTMTTTFTIDNTAPEALDIDLSQIDGDKLTVTAKDNRHVAAVALLSANGTRKMSVKSPNQTVAGQTVTVELDLSSAYGTEFLVAVYDYANNVTTYRAEMDLGSMEREYFTAIDYNTKLDFEMDTPYYGSAYFDGEMLYYGAYKESRDNVTLMSIDVAAAERPAMRSAPSPTVSAPEPRWSPSCTVRWSSNAECIIQK